MANLEDLSNDVLWELLDEARSKEDFMKFGGICDQLSIRPDDDSHDGHLYSMYLAEKQHQERYGSKESKYKIPGRTEIPNTEKGYDRWIRDFVKMNEDKDIRLPKDFSKKSKKQLRGMFYGMLKTYGINEEDILPKKF